MEPNKDILIYLRCEDNKAYNELYKQYYKSIKQLIISNSGTNQDAEDIFQDTMIAFITKLRQENFVLEASVKTYILAIAKNLWLKRLRNNRNDNAISGLYDNKFYEEISLAIDQPKSYRDKLQLYIHQITAHCKGLIHAMFYNNNTIHQIQKDYGYSTIHNAQNQKHKCVEQIRKIKEKQEKQEI